MRNRLTKQAMGLNDSPTTMTAPYPNPAVEKYETGNPDSWAETPNMSHPWDEENAAGREPTGHPKMKTYASMVHEAKELESKALRCLKMAELLLPDSPVDAIERQAVDFMTMSNKSVLSTLRRIREFENNINEARVAKIVDAVLEVVGEEEEEEEEKKAAEEIKPEEPKKEDEMGEDKIATIVEAVLEAIAEEEEEEEEEEKKAAEEIKPEVKPEEVKPEEKDKIATIVEAVLKVMAEEEEEEEEEEKKCGAEEEEEEKKQEVKQEVKPEEKPMTPPPAEVGVKADEMKPEEVKPEGMNPPAEEDKKASEEEEESEEEEKKGSLNVSFDELGDVMASKEDEAILAQLFKATEEESEEEEEEKKPTAKIKTLKNITASKGDNEIEKLASLWRRD